MEISAGVIFLKERAVFMGHATETPHWDIPKGHVEKGESHIDAAIRECEEETGFVCDPAKLVPLGLLDYTRTKQLALFLYVGDNMPEPEHSFCRSTFVKAGRTITEMDDFKYVPLVELETHARVSMIKLLNAIL